MRSRAWILAASLAATSPLIHPAISSAQQQPSADARARAGQHFRAGVAAYTASDFTTALREFQDAYRIAPHPSVRVNLANCYMQLHQPVEALENFEAFLRESASVPAAQRREIERQMGELRAQVGEVRLAISPGSARDAIVSVDGQPVAARGTLRMTPGHHVIEVSADGFQTQRAEVDVLASSSRDVQIALQPPPPPAQPAAVATSAPGPAAGSSTTPAGTASATTSTPAGGTTAETSGSATAATPGAAPSTTAAAEPSTSPARPLAEPADEHHGLPSGLFFAGVGVTAVALVGTVVFGVLAVSNNGTYEDAANRIARGEGDYQTEHDRGTAAAASARQDAVLTDVFLGVTLVAAGATAVLYTQTDFGGERHVTVLPVVSSSGGGLVVTGRF